MMDSSPEHNVPVPKGPGEEVEDDKLIAPVKMTTSLDAPTANPAAATTDAAGGRNRKGAGLNVIRDGGRPFYGRKKELECLHRTYQGYLDCLLASSGKGSTKVVDRAVLIRGVSGCGKTALVHHFVQQLQEQQQDESCTFDCTEAPLILQGKYEEMKRQDPFSALEQAFGNYFLRAHANDDKTCSITPTEKVSILEAIGGEIGLHVLKDVIPALAAAVGWSAVTASTTPTADPTASANSSHNTKGNSDNEIAFKANQLHYTIGKMIQALTHTSTNNSNTPRPLILILDDIQWADSASLDLLYFLIASSLKCPFFLIATCRTNSSANSEDGCHASCCCSGHNHLATEKFVKNLDLENHTQEEITELISREMKCDAIHCLTLASTV
jgi:predicted ATPase